MKKVWNKGLTKKNDEILARIARKKAEWWATHDTTETRRKIGEASKRREHPKGEKSSGWKGGKYNNSRDGYIMIYRPGHPAYKGKRNYIPEHRLVMEKILKRYLSPNEEVHHINGVKDDNRPENLKLVVKKMHFGVVKCPECGHSFEVK